MRRRPAAEASPVTSRSKRRSAELATAGFKLSETMLFIFF